MLVNEKLANKKVATIYGDIDFNAKGESKDLTEAQQKELGKLPSFKYVEEKKPAAPAKKPVAKKEEPKAKAKAKEEAPKKQAPKK